NLPYENLLNGNCLRSVAELKQIFNALVKPSDNLIFSCGSGITACILALGASLAGCGNISVYDGSWTEYGTLTS
ncbi:MAG: sulfurtransferase, partial [Gelidibacter sp.]